MTYLDTRGYVSNIQSFSVNDGEGIRTVIFLSGCPLRCQWCANPETWARQSKLAVYQQRCIGCGECTRVCPNNAINKDKRTVFEERCKVCGVCINNCPGDARKILGKVMSVKEIVGKVSRDLIFFRESGGGVTFSGGEPTMQRDFLLALVKGHEDLGLDMAIETSGHFNWSEVEDVFTKLDLIFVDIKHMNSERHRALTGVGNELILDNIRKLGRLKKNVVVRIPLIKGVNSDLPNLTETAGFVHKFVPGGKIELLLYHNFGLPKYDMLGIPESKFVFEAPAGEELEMIKKAMQGMGVTLVDYK